MTVSKVLLVDPEGCVVGCTSHVILGESSGVLIVLCYLLEGDSRLYLSTIFRRPHLRNASLHLENRGLPMRSQFRYHGVQ